MIDLTKVLVESPFAGKGDTEEERRIDEQNNITYARRCLHDCFERGEAPYASHLLYTQEGVLDDDIPEERKLGIDAGLLWGAEAEKSVFYLDRGFSTGMRYGLLRAIELDRPFEFRVHLEYLDESWILRVHQNVVTTVTPITDWQESINYRVFGLAEDYMGYDDPGYAESERAKGPEPEIVKFLDWAVEQYG
jgi:hypothetical protein